MLGASIAVRIVTGESRSETTGVLHGDRGFVSGRRSSGVFLGGNPGRKRVVVPPGSHLAKTTHAYLTIVTTRGLGGSIFGVNGTYPMVHAAVPEKASAPLWAAAVSAQTSALTQEIVAP